MNFERGIEVKESVGLGRKELYKQDPIKWIALHLYEELLNNQKVPRKEKYYQGTEFVRLGEYDVSGTLFVLITANALKKEELFTTKRLIREWINKNTGYTVIRFLSNRGKTWTHFELIIDKFPLKRAPLEDEF